MSENGKPAVSAEQVRLLMSMSVQELIIACYQNSHGKGFWYADKKAYKEALHNGESLDRLALQDDSCIPEKLMLMVSELSEALEHYRGGGMLDVVGFANAGGEGVWYPQDPNDRDELSAAGKKPDGFAVELADVVIRIFDLAGRFDIPVLEAMARKMAYNGTRPSLHGDKRA